jgi:hypothetical protein
MKSFKAEMCVGGEWCSNTLRFETADEAERYAQDLFMRWTAPSEKRVTPCDDPVTVRWRKDSPTWEYLT